MQAELGVDLPEEAFGYAVVSVAYVEVGLHQSGEGVVDFAVARTAEGFVGGAGDAVIGSRVWSGVFRVLAEPIFPTGE